MVERWKRIYRQIPAPPEGEKVDEPRTVAAPRGSGDAERAGRTGFSFGRRGLLDYDDDE